MSIWQDCRGKVRWVSVITATIVSMLPTVANSSVSYGYDDLGRVTSALYDNGMCIAYSYDANGNRTAQNNAVGTTVWGSGVWGCFNWTP
ncbi:RHS repeat domain-containing protein [Mesorhizobium newzealandense]|uniref:RHS repeat domain-containing protein n=1 Tax=Mesorhizobium newzealandense TaxID=1300302 RepID=A0ABW4UGB6_9HYPH